MNQPLEDQPFEERLKAPRLEILRDIYQTMNRRLQHYRQIGTAAVIGIVAVFILAANSIEEWRRAFSPPLPSKLTEKLVVLSKPLIVYLLVVIAGYFVYQLIQLSSRNFREVSSIIRKIEDEFRVHRANEFITNDSLFPENWSKPWTEDIIPLARRAICWMFAIFTVYLVGVLARALGWL